MCKWVLVSMGLFGGRMLECQVHGFLNRFLLISQVNQVWILGNFQEMLHLDVTVLTTYIKPKVMLVNRWVLTIHMYILKQKNAHNAIVEGGFLSNFYFSTNFFTVRPAPIWVKVKSSWQTLPQHQSRMYIPRIWID